MEKKFLWVGAAMLALVVLVAGVTFFVVRANQSFHGSVIDPPAPAADFTLTGQTGQPVHLSDFRGKYVLLYFGFTNCTQECPATMAVLKQAHLELGDQAGDVQVLFISTDPARDTPQAVGTFVGRFDASFVGVTGSQADLQPVWSAYGVTVLDGGETHSSFIYLIDPQGNLRMTYPYPTPPEDIASDLRLLLQKN